MMNRFRAALALALSVSLLASTAASAISIAPSATVATADSFDSWLDKVPSRRADVRDFEAFLAQQGVAGVLPTREILLNDTSWSECHMDGPYSIAERAYWPHIVDTLRYIHDEVVPSDRSGTGRFRLSGRGAQSLLGRCRPQRPCAVLRARPRTGPQP